MKFLEVNWILIKQIFFFKFGNNKFKTKTFVVYLSQSAIFELAAYWFCNQKPFLTKCCYSFNLQYSDCFFTLLVKKKQKTCFSESYFEVDLVNKLQGVIDKQRSQIKKLDQSILDFKAENEEVNVTWIGSTILHF